MFLSLVFLTGLIGSSLNWETLRPNPYFGAGFGVHQTKGNDGAAKKNQLMWQLGAPFSYAHSHFPRIGRVDLLFLPEISYHQEYLQILLATGPEQVVNLGPRHAPFLLIIGAQLGFHYSALLQSKSYLDQDLSSLTVLERQGFALGSHFYIGPHWAILGGHSLGLQFSTQLSFGKIPRHTIQTSFSQYVGWTGGAHLQFRFRESFGSKF